MVARQCVAGCCLVGAYRGDQHNTSRSTLLEHLPRCELRGEEGTGNLPDIVSTNCQAGSDRHRTIHSLAAACSPPPMSAREKAC